MDTENTAEDGARPMHFKAETRQLLNILIHSLYTERDIFLRELISNASDALTRLDYEMLTNREVLNPDAPLEIRILADKEAGTLTIVDTGIGLTAGEMEENLGTIAHSGARAFVEAYQSEGKNLSDIIGQFGVGFYSAFMVAENIRVVSRSFRPADEAAAWSSDGSDTYTIEAAEMDQRGTRVVLKLKADALEFLEPHRLREIVRKHSDFVAHPIYIGDETEQANRQTAIWRQQPRQVEDTAYDEFYKQLSLDFDSPLAHAHLVVDAPVQMYALLYLPASPERSMFSARKEDGLKLYSRKILIQDYCKELLPEYLWFVQGVVDSEDLPLNVSRESVQANRIMATLKKLVTGKVLDTLKQLAKDQPEKYIAFWEKFSRHIKQGIAIEPADPEGLYPLLRFHTDQVATEWSSLEAYVARMKEGQNDIYYVLGDDDRSVQYSPHLDILRKLGFEALLLTDPLDSFVLVRLNTFKDHKLSNAASAELKLPEKAGDDAPAEEEPAADPALEGLPERFKALLGEHISAVRFTDRLSSSPARLVDPEGAPNQEMQRVYRMLNKEFEAPVKVLELNRSHPIVQKLAGLPDDSAIFPVVVNQIYENALLIEGLHPDPASMIARIQELMTAALN